MTANEPFDDRSASAPQSPATDGPGTTVISQGPRTEPARGRRDDDSDAHLLRLCLDLQLDAMLLTLGASAVSAPAGDDGVPWRRWVSEDVDLACALAGDAQAGRAALPPTLGTDLHHAVPAATIDNLTARYESMRALLADLLERLEPAGGATDEWRPRVREALDRCERRLAELREYRLLSTPARGIGLGAQQQFLPGELLG